MYCAGCGKEIARGMNSCRSCGTPVSRFASTAQFANGRAKKVRVDVLAWLFCVPVWLFCVIGGFVGAIVGYLTRPSEEMAGQLPFQTVITGGESLRDFERMLVPLAQESVNHVLASVVVGAVLVGLAIAMLRHLNFKEARPAQENNGHPQVM